MRTRFRGCTIRHHFGPRAAILLLTLTLLLAGSSNRSAAQAAPTSANVTQELLLALNDIDTMHALGPLKLTPDQAGKLHALLDAARIAYDKQVTELGVSPLLKIANEIRSMRADAVAGKPIPKEFDDRVRKMQIDFQTKRDALNAVNIKRIGAACREVLTPDQVTLAGNLEKQALVKNELYNPKTTSTQLYNAYIVDVFIANSRTLVLLNEMAGAKQP